MDKATKDTLAWINDLRMTWHLGAPLTAMPRGRQRSASHCPVAEALGSGWATVATISFNAQGITKHRVTPGSVAEFINRFDRGRYPELIA